MFAPNNPDLNQYLVNLAKVVYRLGDSHAKPHSFNTSQLLTLMIREISNKIILKRHTMQRLIGQGKYNDNMHGWLLSSYICTYVSSRCVVNLFVIWWLIIIPKKMKLSWSFEMCPYFRQGVYLHQRCLLTNFFFVVYSYG